MIIKIFEPEDFGCVATIGNFDGVHLGHQDLINRLNLLSEKFDLPTTVILFEPQPAEFFLKDDLPNRLTRVREKIRLLDFYGVSPVLVLKFNEHLAAYSASEFVEDILLKKLGIKALVVGDDFRFGKKREGTINYCRAFLKEKISFSSEPLPSWWRAKEYQVP